MIVWRVLIVFFSVLALFIAALIGMLAIAFLGPSESARDRLALSLLETSAADFIPAVFLSSELLSEIADSNTVFETTEVTDTSLISAPDSESAEAEDEWADHPNGIRIEMTYGGTYRGYVMLIRDPSRVYAATSSDFKSGKPGLRIPEALKREGAVAAINGGGFPDDGTFGVPGDVPIGLVFSKGRLLWGDENKVYSSVMGFDNNNIFIVGNMSPKEAKKIGIRDAMCFGPILIVNGEPAQITGSGGSLNPRTAIGQRADGTVIFLCVDGRMPSSLGASYTDLIEIMMEYGAVNAANLDGGTSTTMMYKGETVNIPSSLYGPRRIPTFFMVRAIEGQDDEG